MDNLLAGGVSALGFGLLASISPCSLATNAAAVTYVGRQVGSPRRVILASLSYTLGRSMTYTALAALIVGGLLSVPDTARFLQRYLGKAIGPLLILVGVVLLDRFPLPSFGGGLARRFQERKIEGVAGSLILGAAFALAFCPVTAALFFGSLIPLSLHHRSVLVIPVLFGLATGVPVLGLALPLALGAGWVGRALRGLTGAERWARRIAAAVFCLVGIYETARSTLGWI